MSGMFMSMLVFALVPLAALAILGVFVLAVIRALRGSPSRNGKRSGEEETRLIQEIYQGLSRMEKRVESLETILFDFERKEKK